MVALTDSAGRTDAELRAAMSHPRGHSLLVAVRAGPAWALLSGPASTRRSVLRPDTNIWRDMFHRTADFRGEEFLVGTLPYSHNVRGGEAGQESYWGYEVLMLRVAEERYNLRVSLVQPADQSWGSIAAGSWTGLVGQAGYGEVGWPAYLCPNP